MNSIDLLIAIRGEMYGAVCNYGIESVLKEEQWKEFVYKCVCAGVTEDQIEALIKLGVDKDKIYEILNIGKDCGTCTKDDKESE